MKIRNLFIVLTLLWQSTAFAATIEMQVNGLVCAFCAQGIEKTMRAKPETADVLVSLEHGLVAVVLKPAQDLTDAVVTTALTEAGYTVVAIKRSERSLAQISAALAEQGDD